jgi:hypothetical protein
MTDDLGPRLQRLGTVAKSLNEVSDEVTKIVQGVESHLSETLRIDIRAGVLIEHDEDESGSMCIDYNLVYGRQGSSFRFYVVRTVEVDGSQPGREERLWANCPRDLKLLAFQKLPELLDAIAVEAEALLTQVKVNFTTVQDLIPVRERAVKP